VNRDQIIAELYTHKELKRALRKYAISAETREDLWHYVIEAVCKLPEESLLQLHSSGRLKHYAFITLRNLAGNTRSVYFKECGLNEFKLTMDEVDVIADEEDSDQLPVIEMDQFKAFLDYAARERTDITMEAIVTREYINYTPIKRRSYRDFQIVTGIHYSSVCVYVKRMVKEFNQNQNQCVSH
jgi:hypothetical protein